LSQVRSLEAMSQPFSNRLELFLTICSYKWESKINIS
jgi:hypothetical protein